MSLDPSVYRNLHQLRAKVESHSARVHAAHADHLTCRRGCSGCCQTERTVNDLEFEALREGYEALDSTIKNRLAVENSGSCPLLLNDACVLYDERPLICRSHGLPLVMDGRLDVCPLNFEDLELETLPEGDLLSVDTLTAILTVSNMLFCQETNGSPERRRPVSALWEDPSK